VTVRIVDVSNYQGQVDWSAVVASGVAGGIVKATEGTGFTDGQFIRNWTALGRAGARRGCYHFARPGSSSPTDQANRFLTVVGTTLPTDILVLDLEVGDGDLSWWALTFLEAVQGATGNLPWLYSYAPFVTAHLHDVNVGRYPLWLAAYQSTPPPAPAPWRSWVLWQHTDKAQIPGITGLCDESVGELTSNTPTIQAVKPMYDPPIGPIAAVWQRDGTGDVIAAVSPAGAVYAWGVKWMGNTAGKDYWGNRQAAAIGPRPDGVMPGYRITATSGENYDLPDGLDKLA
jgi:GH25 family lysozyme M1 (1,4-beta-N-acetylmuramidase)